MYPCHDLMTLNPICCLADDPVERIAQWMDTEDIGAVPVLSDYQTRRLIGIVTDRDLALRVVGAGRDVHTTRVGDVMSPDPITCQADDDITLAMQKMADHQIRRLPIVNSGGELAGIIAQADIAIRLHDPQKTAAVVHEISQPDEEPVQG
jgi:CBS domain-containing protein